jgi:myo-inositol 2-dehydrogenase/D-chiro-inositol 1-dehydrogenase
MVGFHRRFDPSQAALRTGVRAGKIGELEQMTIVCRDPSPPPRAYLRGSGGIFRDMMIHDFDQMRAITGIQFCHVLASGATLFDPAKRQEGDWDTASAQLIGPRGETCTILNSRRCVYGFEQKIEIFGSEGSISMENPRPLFISHFSAEGEKRPPLLPFFPERYESAYREELNHFLLAIEEDRHFDVTIDDGLQALAIANAAHESAKKQVRIDLSDENSIHPTNL